MTPTELALLTKALGPIVRDFTARAVAEALAPVLARNADLEQRILELETRPEPAQGPAGPTGEKGDPGVGVAGLFIDADGRLRGHLSTGQFFDAGPVPRGTDGAPGQKGDPGDRGEPGLSGPVGSVGERGPMGQKGDPGERGETGLPGAPGAIGEPGRPGVDGKHGAAGLDGTDGMPGERGLQGEKGLDGIHGRDGRDGAPGLPGMAGDKGLDGRHGVDGRDGADGLGFDDFDLVLDEARGWVLRLAQGDRVKEWVLGIPFDANVWTAGLTYPKGAGTTWDGGYWIALTQTTAAPGEGSPDWRLAVRRGKQGREGKQGKDGASGRDLTQMDPQTGRKW